MSYLLNAEPTALGGLRTRDQMMTLPQFSGWKSKRSWERFKKELEERQQRRAVLLYIKYCKRFGSPFATADFPKPRKVDLLSIAPLLEKALAEGCPISDAAALVAALRV
jgi:hypothetical protein